jgi:hypothetical protein
VTMKLGSPVRTTMKPLRAPMARHSAKVIRIACQTGQPSVIEKMAIIMPAKPIIEPTERSNSPAIISRQAPTAMIMNWAETTDQLRTPWVEHAAVAGKDCEKHEHDHRAADAAQFRADQGFAQGRCLLDAFVACRCVSRIGHETSQTLISMGSKKGSGARVAPLPGRNP